MLTTTDYKNRMRQSEVVSTVTMPQTTDILSTDDSFTTIPTTSERIQVTTLPRPVNIVLSSFLSSVEIN